MKEKNTRQTIAQIFRAVHFSSTVMLLLYHERRVRAVSRALKGE
jgi:hypothetical protein